MGAGRRGQVSTRMGNLFIELVEVARRNNKRRVSQRSNGQCSMVNGQWLVPDEEGFASAFAAGFAVGAGVESAKEELREAVREYDFP